MRNVSEDQTWQKLGKRYRRMRVLRKLPIESIRRYGMSIKRYAAIEAGTMHYLSELFKIAKMLGVEPVRLLKGILG